MQVDDLAASLGTTSPLRSDLDIVNKLAEDVHLELAHFYGHAVQ
jgi:hypothetical protein